MVNVSLALPSNDEARPTLSGFGDYIGGSLAMRRLHPICRRLASSEVSVLIQGETGSGKEALARTIHAQGPRAGAPFVVLDCTSVEGARIDEAFAEAEGGTLLIDEIGDLDRALQGRLLRGIESSDVRLVVATRRELDADVQAGRFRNDLFFRLAIVRLDLPPLRERSDDIELLARHFWRQYGGAQAFPEEVLPRLRRHAWPGNVRELGNTVARLAALGDLGTDLFMSHGDVPPTNDFLDGVVTQDLGLAPARDLVLREFERRYCKRLLQVHGDVPRAAAASGIGERYLRKIRARAR